MFHGRAPGRWSWRGKDAVLMIAGSSSLRSVVKLGGVSEPEPSLTLLASGGQEGLRGAPSLASVSATSPAGHRSEVQPAPGINSTHYPVVASTLFSLLSSLWHDSRWTIICLFSLFKIHGSWNMIKHFTDWLYNSFYGNFNENTHPLY